MSISLRTRLAVVGITGAGLAALAGCAGEATFASGSTSYADGTYAAQASYQAPSGTESITVELTIAGDKVTAVTVSQEASDREAREFQERFASGISAEVVGRDISSLSVSRVSGSSLTSSGFNAALEQIRSQAA